MKQEKDGTEHAMFFDTYALIAIAQGNPNYKRYASGIKVVTTILNLYELFYILIEQHLESEAEKFFERFISSCVEINPSTIKEAARFRLINKKKHFSYVDALGYLIAKHMNISFLTGDDSFKSLEGVIFVK